MDEHDSPTLVPSLERAAHAVALWIERSQRDVGVTQAEAHVLAYLAHAPPSSINDLHASFGHRRSTLTSVLDRLERRGLVRRGPHPTSRRSVMVHLTESGRQAGERIAAALRDLDARVAARTGGEDLGAFARVLAALEAAMEEDVG